MKLWDDIYSSICKDSDLIYKTDPRHIHHINTACYHRSNSNNVSNSDNNVNYDADSNAKKKSFLTTATSLTTEVLVVTHLSPDSEESLVTMAERVFVVKDY